MKTQAIVTFSATLLAIAALIITGPGHMGAVTVDDSATLTESHCLASVDEGLDWYGEGDREIVQDTVAVMQDACDHLGHASEAFLYEDGSWIVLAKEDFNGPDGLVKAGIWWKGCMSTTAPCAD